MVTNKVGQWALAAIYMVLFTWMLLHSKHPSLQDVPLVFAAGFIVSLLCLITFTKKVNKVLMALNIALLIANIAMYFAAYRLVSGAFKN